MQSDESKAWPACIPPHAENVTYFGDLWLWEFCGGAVVYLVDESKVMEPIRLLGENISGLAWWFRSEEDRYNDAIKREKARQESYEEYRLSVRPR